MGSDKTAEREKVGGKVRRRGNRRRVREARSEETWSRLLKQKSRVLEVMTPSMKRCTVGVVNTATDGEKTKSSSSTQSRSGKSA